MQGSARVIRCLQDNREELGMECSATLFDQEVTPGHLAAWQYVLLGEA